MYVLQNNENSYIDYHNVWQKHDHQKTTTSTHSFDKAVQSDQFMQEMATAKKNIYYDMVLSETKLLVLFKKNYFIQSLLKYIHTLCKILFFETLSFLCFTKQD